MHLSDSIGKPLNCVNNTYHARDVELQWEKPIQTVQDSQIIGYNLICYSDDPWADLTADLSATQNSTAVTFTINPVSPFTDYICELSAINEVGVGGPSTQCIFSTQQDGEQVGVKFMLRMSNIIHVRCLWSHTQQP